VNDKLKSFSPPDDIHRRVPVNKQAALTCAKGTKFQSRKRITNGALQSPVPMPLRPATKQLLNTAGFVDCTGKTIGRLTCIGLISLDCDYSGWLMRCSCGQYVNRSQKAILNPRNDLDRCENCRHMHFLKKSERWRRTGKDTDLKDIP
jgi:hypothetical protein